MKKLAAVLSTVILATGMTAFAQTAGQDIKNAGSDIKGAAKSTGKATAKTTKTAGKKIKKGATKTADAVDGKNK
ncbi:hypothetical protein [Nevskia soli]|jgi:hypothetical protein|uniref:hypothetical protein n=1 Tax=Nevskia soli TaxID=418856 RepID=UPI0015D830CE|nr:hypothetical protein [Nevskia soli]